MKIKDKLIVIIAIIAVIIVCLLYPSKQIYFEGEEDFKEVISYNFHYNEKQNIDYMLKYQKYIYTEDEYDDYLAIIVYKDNKAYLNHYKVFYTSEEILISKEVDIPISSNCDFIISLPDSLKSYNWSINDKRSSLKLIKKSKLAINSAIDDLGKYRRENLYFNSGNSGEKTIVLSYSDHKELIIKEIILKIKVK